MKNFKFVISYISILLLIGLITILDHLFIKSIILSVLSIMAGTAFAIVFTVNILKQILLVKLRSINNIKSKNIFDSIEKIKQEIINKDTYVTDLEQQGLKVKSISTGIENNLDNLINDFNWVLDKAAEVGGKTEEQKSIIKNSASEIKVIIDSISTLESDIAKKGQHFENSVEKLTDMSLETARIQELSQLAHQSSEKLKQDISNADQAVQSNLSSIEDIYESSHSMKKITETITDISSQTNLLAMNAAIEAAHAGEKGKGFAIVASEVRKLAENSAKQASGIDHILKDMDIKISSGREISKKTSIIFNEITNTINNTVTSINQISSAVNSQYIFISNLLPNLKILVQNIQDLETVASSHKSQSSNIVNLTDKIATLSLEIQEGEKLLIAKDFEILEMMKKNQQTAALVI